MTVSCFVGGDDVLLFPINLIGEITLPVSLALRLLGNIISGAVLSKIIVGLASFIAIPFLPVYNAIFDIFFGLVQTVVFLLLTIIFTGNKVSDEEKNFEEKKVEISTEK